MNTVVSKDGVDKLKTPLSRSSTESEATPSNQQSQESVSSVKRTQPPREDVSLCSYVGIGVSFVLTFIVKAFEYRLRDVPHESDKGPFIYYWVLPNPTAVTRLSLAWGPLYACHQNLIAHLIRPDTYQRDNSKTASSQLCCTCC